MTNPTNIAPTLPGPAPDPELALLQEEIAKIMAEPEAFQDPVAGVEVAIQQLDQAAAELSQQLAAEPEPAETQETAPPSPDDSAALNSILAETDESPEPDPAAALEEMPPVQSKPAVVESPPAAPTDPEAELQHLMNQVKQSIEAEAANTHVQPEIAAAQAPTPPNATSTREAAPAPAPTSIEDVDARVASLAETAIAKDEAEAAKLDAAVKDVALEPAAPTAPVVPATMPAAAPATTPTAVIEKPEHRPGPESKPATKPETKADPKPIPERKPKPPGFFKTKIEAPLLRAIGLASQPLASKPGLIRAAGLVSFNTLLLGAGLWVYALYFRPAHAAREGHQTFDFAHSGLPQPDLKASEAHAPARGHVESPEGAPAPKKEEGHGVKKEEGAGGEHGASAKPAEPKKSIIASAGTKYLVNEKLTKKPGDKPKEAKGEGHGGGGGGGH